LEKAVVFLPVGNVVLNAIYKLYTHPEKSYMFNI